MKRLVLGALLAITLVFVGGQAASTTAAAHGHAHPNVETWGP